MQNKIRHQRSTPLSQILSHPGDTGALRHKMQKVATRARQKAFMTEEERAINKLRRQFDEASYEELAAFDVWSLFGEDDEFIN
jgi:hypothetical protein